MEKQWKIPMIVTKETIKDFGISPEDVVTVSFGSRRYPAILVDGTEEQYRAYVGPIWKELKEADRNGRCFVLGERGKLIRCPETNKCQECEHISEKAQSSSVSFSELVEKEVEIPIEESFEDDVIYKSILEDLVVHLNEVDPQYGAIFRLLYDGATQQEMETDLGIKRRTLSKYIKSIREIVQPLAKDIFDR